MERLKLKIWLIVVLLLLLGQGTTGKAVPVGTAFTYQGRLVDANQPAEGFYDFQFKLFDGPTDGNQVGTTISFLDVGVLDDGCFTVELDFVGDDSNEPQPLGLEYRRVWGDGEARWLEIAVRPALAPQAEPEPLPLGFTVLSPRQKITPTPYALYALSAGGGPEPEPLVGGSGTDHYIPRWLGTSDLENSVIYQTDAGNIGIGTITPSRKLDVESDGDGQIEVKGTDPTQFGGVVIYNNLGRFGRIAVGGEKNPNVNLRRNLFIEPPGDYDIVLHTGGADTSIKAGTGNVGIGTTSPGAKLEVAGQVKITGGSPGSGRVLTSDATGLASWQLASGGLPSGTTGQTLRHDGTNWIANSVLYNNGTNVGIGTNSPGQKLDVSQGNIILSEPGGTMRYIMLQRGSNVGSLSTANGRITVGAESGYDAMIQNSSGAGIIVKNTSGNIGIGMTDPSEKLDVIGTARLRGISAGAGTAVVADGSGKLFKQSSSRRYKTNIQNLEDDADKVLELRPVRFQWKTTGQDEIGLIAEEVEGVARDLVLYDQEGKPDAVKYDKVALYLLSVVKTQQQRIEDLEAKQAENRSLAQRIEALELMLQQQKLTAKEVQQ